MGYAHPFQTAARRLSAIEWCAKMTEPTSSEQVPQIEVTLRQPASSPETLSSSLTKAIAPILGIGGALGALLLSLGWSFGWHWFDAWDVPYASLGLGPSILLEYGRLVVLHFWWLAVLWIGLVFACAWCITHFTLPKGSMIGLCLAAFLVPWFSSHSLAEQVARAELSRISETRLSSLPEVQILFRPGLEATLGDRVAATLNENLCHRLLYKAADGLWLVRMNAVGGRYATVFIPSDTITYLRLRQPRGGNC
jgi:hypothetical protein